MTFTRRNLCLALLVALLIGHVGIAVHAATHVAGDASDCALCFSFTDTSYAAADGQVREIPDVAYRFSLTDPDAGPSERQDAPYHPRGPPLV
ncbi:MAG: hypothetical protein EX272_08795 [Chromatiales bacterium]|nr:MAG: hypothetical protein EX272_08795 [Chromatiales bacterium]